MWEHLMHPEITFGILHPAHNCWCTQGEGLRSLHPHPGLPGLEMGVSQEYILLLNGHPLQTGTYLCVSIRYHGRRDLNEK